MTAMIGCDRQNTASPPGTHLIPPRIAGHSSRAGGAFFVGDEMAEKQLQLNWDYDESIKKMRRLIPRWKDMSVDMLEELHIARKSLSSRYYRDGQLCPSWAEYCEDIGLPKRTANYWLSQYDPTKKCLIEDKSLVGKFTGNIENYTPTWIIEKVKEVMGEIDLDPASCDFAQKKVKAKRYLTERDDALREDVDWNGRIFLNPPYAAGVIDRFVEKLVSSSFDEAILLTNNNTDTKWFYAAAISAQVVCFTSGRINFYTEEIEKTLPTNGQTFFYFGDNADRFCAVFTDVGLLMRVV